MTGKVMPAAEPLRVRERSSGLQPIVSSLALTLVAGVLVALLLLFSG
jgi:hypothetical protein